MIWNPDPVAFTIPFLNLPVYIYGICFVTGFIIAYYLLLWMLQKDFKLSAPVVRSLLDKMTWFVVAGTIIGARLGHVIFYDWDRYKNNLWLILNTREGGLASHGGTVGVFISLVLFYVYSYRIKYQRSFLELLDRVVIPTALVACFIRLGNFFNQEIIGIPTDMPWGITFLYPVDHAAIVSRHPAQLYEAFSYLGTMALLLFLWTKPWVKLKQGFLTGLFFVCIFGSRFFIEFIKEQQASILDQSYLQAGQTLSIPFIVIGFSLMIWSLRSQKQTLEFKT